MRKQRKSLKHKKKKTVHRQGLVYVYSGYNNTLITVTDLTGNTICWKSAGSNFKGSKKSTPYAASIISDSVAKEAYSYGLREVTVLLKGVGNAKIHSVKALRNGGLMINRILDITPLKHGGCKPKKRRRT